MDLWLVSQYEINNKIKSKQTLFFFAVYVVVFVNVGAAPNDVDCDTTCVTTIGLLGQHVVVRDLWQRVVIARIASLQEFKAKQLAPQGGFQMLRFSVQ